MTEHKYFQRALEREEDWHKFPFSGGYPFGCSCIDRLLADKEGPRAPRTSACLVSQAPVLVYYIRRSQRDNRMVSDRTHKRDLSSLLLHLDGPCCRTYSTAVVCAHDKGYVQCPSPLHHLYTVLQYKCHTPCATFY